jgi:hypothetical protein
MADPWVVESGASAPDARNDFQRHIGVGERQYLYGRHVGTIKTIPVQHDKDGKLGGFQHEHWSGRVDAEVHARSVKLHMSTE